MLHLVPMTEAEFEAYSATSMAEYAEEYARSGHFSPEEARSAASREFHQLLPAGVRTPGHHLYTLWADAEAVPVGMVWFSVEQAAAGGVAFVFDVRVGAAFQRRGYASDAIRAVEERAREMGAASISLHVFGHNHAARAMYEKLGFTPSSITLTKPITPAS